MLSLSFPAVLERLQLQPFDMVKMISLFVKAEPALPKELKRHLFTIEEKVRAALGQAYHCWRGACLLRACPAALLEQCLLSVQAVPL